MTPDDIEAEYRRRLRQHPEARWGWSFMYTPEATLDRASAVLIGLNPGGSQIDQPGEWDYNAGANAYVDESWRGLEAGEHHLQRQVRAMFAAAGLSPASVFAANLVPFRSPSWRALPDQKGALVFGGLLWTALLRRTPAKFFFSLGKLAAEELAGLCAARRIASWPAGWGLQTIDEYRDDQGRVIVALPHLSRFKLFSPHRQQASELIGQLSREQGFR